MANILIVDDSEHIRSLLSDVLIGKGHRTAQAASGEEAIGLIRESVFDAVITDLRMGELDGLDLLEAIRSGSCISPDTEVIMITGYATIDAAIEAMKLGSYDFVTKPINIEELLMIVDKALKNNEPADSIKPLMPALASNSNIPALSHPHSFTSFRAGSDFPPSRGKGMEQAQFLTERGIGARGEDRYSICSFDNIVGNTPAMLEVFNLMEKVCQVDSAILITGESGTGKELVAQAIHVNSRLRDEPFVPVNCAALPEHIQESELFGHAKGSFTDAFDSKRGLFEEANGGTVFLDEIADAASSTQAKLLRFLEDGEIRRVGENNPVHADVRLIAATSKDLSEAVEKGTFREDLYYRINVIEIRLPPLRERKDDIPLLVNYFIRKHWSRRGRHTGKNMSQTNPHISQETLLLLMQYSWPGNVRELQNAIQYALALTRDDTITPSSLPTHIQTGYDNALSKPKSKRMSLHELKKAYILQILEECSWNHAKAAATLGIGRATIYRKLNESDE